MMEFELSLGIYITFIDKKCTDVFNNTVYINQSC